MKLLVQPPTVRPAFDAALFDAEDEDSAAPNHRTPLELVETAGYAWY